jgi:hypothetical protein
VVHSASTLEPQQFRGACRCCLMQMAMMLRHEDEPCKGGARRAASDSTCSLSAAWALRKVAVSMCSAHAPQPSASLLLSDTNRMYRVLRSVTKTPLHTKSPHT